MLACLNAFSEITTFELVLSVHVCSAIRVKPGGMSRGVKRLTKPHVPNLSKFHDISEFVLG